FTSVQIFRTFTEFTLVRFLPWSLFPPLLWKADTYASNSNMCSFTACGVNWRERKRWTASCPVAGPSLWPVFAMIANSCNKALRIFSDIFPHRPVQAGPETATAHFYGWADAMFRGRNANV